MTAAGGGNGPRLPARPGGHAALGTAGGPIGSPDPAQQGRWLEGVFGTRFHNDLATVERVLTGLRGLTWSEDTRGGDMRGGEKAGTTADDPDARTATIAAELTGLRQRVAGVRSSVIAGVDGFLLLHDTDADDEPHDVAALAAAAVGVGRQTGLAFGHGDLREATMHSQRGYFAVYAVCDTALLAVVGDEDLNVARLHLEARNLAPRLAALLARPATPSRAAPRTPPSRSRAADAMRAFITWTSTHRQG